ncbi:surfactin synthase thioesterase subunit [Crossiella equi]|uniref:Surfactin synthase thioesterase subunit n=1 Tax=Crossiella equi TaxID=130796 RepID=A0ABS5ATD8_9PSEU|nr:alpha/beta fold hydrolase [Crossiella equi]MBP2479712.1 surfactin synthase thioesterase subunit [Crossiella equi]
MTSRGRDARFLRRLAPSGTPRYRLACFPHAGGGAAAFAPWLPLLPPDVELLALRLPGRESRLAEDPHSGSAAAIAECADALRSFARDEVPLAYFGHSMGGLLAHETYLALAAEHAVPPPFLAVSAVPSPLRQGRRGRSPSEPDRAELMRLLRDFGGTGPAALADEELLDLVLPALEADLRLLDGHRPTLPPAPVACPLLSFAGAADAVVSEVDVRTWRHCAGGRYAHYRVPGDHFFYRVHAEEVLARLEHWSAAAPAGAAADR